MLMLMMPETGQCQLSPVATKSPDGNFLLLYRHALDIRRCRFCTPMETATPPEPSSLTITLYGIALFSWIDNDLRNLSE